MFPGFGSWDGVDKNARLQKRLNGWKYPCALKFRCTWNTADALQWPEGQNECSQCTQAEKGFHHYPATFWFLGTFLNAEVSSWNWFFFFCFRKACTQVITVIFRGDNLPKIKEIPFWNFICTVSSSGGKNDISVPFPPKHQWKEHRVRNTLLQGFAWRFKTQTIMKTKYELSRKHFLLSQKAGTRREQALINNLLSAAHN